MKLVRGNLSKQEAILVAREIEDTPYIIKYSTNKLMSYKDSYKLYVENTLVGVFIVEPVGSWVDLKILLVLRDYRGRGYGKKLFDYVFNLYKESGRGLYLCTRNSIISGMATSRGFNQATLFSLPREVIWQELLLEANIFRWVDSLRKARLYPEAGSFIYYVLRADGGD